MKSLRPLCVVVAGLLLAGAIAGCGKKQNAPAPAPTPEPGADPGMSEAEMGRSGQEIFDQTCAKCHSLGPETGGKKKKGPDLAKIGSEHDAAWIAEHVKDPKTHEPKSGMPSFEKKLSAEEIRSVADYLAGMK